MEACGNCRCYRPAPAALQLAPASIGVDTRGTCRRFPASVAKTTSDWCFEHKPVPADKPAVKPKGAKRK